MEYAGFWKRFWAGGVDLLVLLPFMFLFRFLGGLSKEVAIVVAIIHPASYWIYNICFHGKWGATLGKMALKIKVVKERDGTKISFNEAFLRFSVDLVIAIIAVIAYMVALMSLSESEFSSLNWRERGVLISNRIPVWWYYTNILGSNTNKSTPPAQNLFQNPAYSILKSLYRITPLKLFIAIINTVISAGLMPVPGLWGGIR